MSLIDPYSAQRLNMPQQYWEIYEEYTLIFKQRNSNIEKQNTETDFQVRQKISQKINEIDQALEVLNQKFKDFFLNFAQIFKAQTEKISILMPDKTVKIWRQYVYEIAEKMGLNHSKRFNQEFPKEKMRECIVWKLERRTPFEYDHIEQDQKDLEDQIFYSDKQNSGSSSNTEQKFTDVFKGSKSQSVSQPLKQIKGGLESDQTLTINTNKQSENHLEKQTKPEVNTIDIESEFMFKKFPFSPEPVTDVTAINLNRIGMLSIVVVKPQSFNNPILQYTIFKYKENLTKQEEESKEIQKNLVQVMQSQTQEFDLKLESGLNTFFISAQNQNGESKMSKPFNYYWKEFKTSSLLMAGSIHNSAIPTEWTEQMLLNQNLVLDQESNLNYIRSALQFNFQPNYFSSISFGSASLFCTLEGYVVQCGRSLSKQDQPNYTGQISQDSIAQLEEVPSKPFLIEFPFNQIIRIVAVGKSHMSALSIEGEVYTWGLNLYGVLGHGNQNHCLSPQKVQYFKEKNAFITDLKSGMFHMLAKTSQNEVYSWGYCQDQNTGMPVKNRFGEIINFQNKCSSALFPLLLRSNCRMIEAGGFHSAIISEDDNLYVWGDNAFGQLGIENQGDKLETEKIFNLSTPVKLSFFEQNGYQIQQISCGYRHNIVLALKKQQSREQIFTWGWNQYQQCTGSVFEENPSEKEEQNVDFMQMDDENCVFSPKVLQLFKEDISIQRVWAGHGNSFVETSDQRLYGFGNYRHGAFGANVNEKDCEKQNDQQVWNIQKYVWDLQVCEQLVEIVIDQFNQQPIIGFQYVEQ